MFGVNLGVPVYILKKFRIDEKDCDQCMIAVLNYWLNNTQKPTWNDVVNALKEIDRIALADQIKSKFVDTAGE